MNTTHNAQINKHSLPTALAELRPFISTLIANGQVDDALDMVFKLLEALRNENNLMAIRLARLLRDKFGKTSEKISRTQLELFQQTIEAGEAQAPEAPLPTPPAPELQKPSPRKRNGRNPLPPDLPRETKRFEPSPSEQVCAICGLPKCVIGMESSEILEYEPAKFKVIVEERVKMACRPCEGELVIIEERKQLRDEYARAATAALKAWALKNQPWVEPKSPLAKAITYTLNQWDSLQVYLEDGAIPIDNNRVEQRMRPVAIGRKNYLFAGSDVGAQRAAILYSIIAACHLADKPPFAYIRSVIDRICRGWPASRLDDLLPENWKPDPEPSQTSTDRTAADSNGLTSDVQTT
jgi:hypothetical protein